MRVHTHIVFSTAVALWLVTAWQTLLITPLTTILIDMLGHSRSHGIPRRIWLTHDWLLSLPIFILPLSWVYTWTPLIHVPLLTAFIINAVTLHTLNARWHNGTYVLSNETDRPCNHRVGQPCG